MERTDSETCNVLNCSAGIGMIHKPIPTVACADKEAANNLERETESAIVS